eukprot:1053219-Ditylum_brightwellii.AAC.1
MYFHYSRGFVFAPPVHIDYREGTFPPFISHIQDERSESDERRESPYAYVTDRLYVGARQVKQG